MPVGMLLVEGLGHAPEGSILPKIVPTGCTVVLGGSKTDLANQVLGARRAHPGGVVAALRDRDFDDDGSAPVATPRMWRSGRAKEWIGWTWERVELENYLIDPIVVANALGSRAPSPTRYQQTLDDAAKRLAAYTAARTSLSRWPPFSPMTNRWGTEAYGGDHVLPRDLGADACRRQIREIVRTYEAERRVEVDDVLARFEKAYAECQSDGVRSEHYLTFFSGKDLVLGMAEGLRSLGLDTPKSFCNRIASKVEESTEDVATWLPEWSALRTALVEIPTNAGPG